MACRIASARASLSALYALVKPPPCDDPDLMSWLGLAPPPPCLVLLLLLTLDREPTKPP